MDGDTLVIKVNMKAESGISASGKSFVIASTHGNMPVHEAEIGTMFGLNVYRKR
jgi:hypothetical protein